MVDGRDTERPNSANEMGPAGVNADPDAGNPVSGMPAGGPYDLGSTAHELGDTPDAQSVVDPLGVGMDAYRAGVARSECPYPSGSGDGDRWLDGWDHQKNAESDADSAV